MPSEGFLGFLAQVATWRTVVVVNSLCALHGHNQDENFEFNQDFEIEEGTRSPGWIRYQKRIK